LVSSVTRERGYSLGDKPAAYVPSRMLTSYPETLVVRAAANPQQLCGDLTRDSRGRPV
jgi:hypothetical protein